MTRRIAVFTATRAEYGLLRWPMEAIADHPDLELHLVVSGAHLSPAHGMTVKAIEGDGFTVDERIDMQLAADHPVAIATSLSLAVAGCARALDRLRPDCLLLLGDRYEALAAAQAAMILRIPIAHVHGGESTEGLIDEAIRHSISKMSHLHFTSAEPHSRRLRQLGEDPGRVFTVGAPGLDARHRLRLLDRAALEADLEWRFGEPTILVTYHPVTLEDRDPAVSAESLIQACERLGPSPRFLVTGHNADTDGHRIGERFAAWERRSDGRVKMVESLGQVRYLSALACVDLVVGNSSSGLIEAPAFGVPTVNIGRRQMGRLRGGSVIDCDDESTAIEQAMRKGLDPAEREHLVSQGSPYGDGRASERIAERLATEPLDGILFKRFHDWDGPCEQGGADRV